MGSPAGAPIGRVQRADSRAPRRRGSGDIAQALRPPRSNGTTGPPGVGTMVRQASLFSSLDRALRRHPGHTIPCPINAARLGYGSALTASEELSAAPLSFDDERTSLRLGLTAKTCRSARIGVCTDDSSVGLGQTISSAMSLGAVASQD